MKTGKITYITPKGKGTPFIDNQTGQEVVLENYNIGFADGTEFKFKAKGEWKYPVGSEIQFEVSNADWKTAKGAKLINNAAPNRNASGSNKGFTPKDDVQKYIIRQSSLNRATDLYSKNGNWDEQHIIETARIFENYVYNG